MNSYEILGIHVNSYEFLGIPKNFHKIRPIAFQWPQKAKAHSQGQAPDSFWTDREGLLGRLRARNS